MAVFDDKRNKLPLKLVTEEVFKERWSVAPWPLLFASALQGVGIVETSSALLQKLVDRFDQTYQLSTTHGLSQRDFVAGVVNALDGGKQ